MRRCAFRMSPALLVVALGPAPALRPDEPENYLRNPGAEQVRGDLPADWSPIAPPGTRARVRRATDQAHAGKASLSIAVQDEKNAAQWVQQVKGAPRGTPLRLSAQIRTEGDVKVNLMIQAFARGEPSPRAVAGAPVVEREQDWTLVRADPITVPAGATTVIVRAVAWGRGKAWLDDFALVAEEGAP